MTPTISYIICCHGEEQVFTLINFIKQHKAKEDKIVVLENPTTEEYNRKLKQQSIKIVQYKLTDDYSAYRNSVLEHIHTDYMMWLDYDEQPHLQLIKNIKSVIESNYRPDIIMTPRLNIVKGIKPIHAIYLNFSLQGEIVCWPDPQIRIIKNRVGLKFVDKCHEHIEYDKKKHRVIELEHAEEYSLIHTKTIEKQLSTHQENIEKYADTRYYNQYKLDGYDKPVC